MKGRRIRKGERIHERMKAPPSFLPLPPPALVPSLSRSIYLARSMRRRSAILPSIHPSIQSPCLKIARHGAWSIRRPPFLLRRRRRLPLRDPCGQAETETKRESVERTENGSEKGHENGSERGNAQREGGKKTDRQKDRQKDRQTEAAWRRGCFERRGGVYETAGFVRGLLAHRGSGRERERAGKKERERERAEREECPGTARSGSLPLSPSPPHSLSGPGRQ